MASPLGALATLFFRPTTAGPGIAGVLSAESEIDRGLAILQGLLRGGQPFPVEPSQDPYDRLRFAMENLREVEVGYTRALDGSHGSYLLRPYEIGYHPISGRPVLWAQVAEGSGASPIHESDPATGGAHTDTIHAFLEARLNWDSLRVTDRNFVPDWPVQIDTV